MEEEGLKITSLEVLSGKRLPNLSYGTKSKKKKKNTGREIGRGVHEFNFQHSIQNPLYLKKNYR